MTTKTDGPRYVAAIDAADDVFVAVPLPRLIGSQEAAQEIIAGIHCPSGVVLINGRDCSSASPTVAAWFVDRLIGDTANGRMRLRGCPADFVEACIDRARSTGVVDRLEVVAAPTRMQRRPAPLHPVVTSDTCPREFEGARCIHGYSHDEFGYVTDDHMHLGYDADGKRVEWLSAWQAPSFAHPHAGSWGIVVDVLAVLLLLLGALIFGAGCIKGGGGGYWDLSTTTRIIDGIVAAALVGIAMRIVVLVAYLGQQWGPDPFKGRQ